MTEIRNSLDFLCASFDEMKNCSRATDKRIDHLLALIKSKDERIEQLEAKVNDLEQNSKKKNIIVTGLNTSSYATVSRPTTRSSTSTDTDDHPPTSTTENSIMRANFVKFEKVNWMFALSRMTLLRYMNYQPGGMESGQSLYSFYQPTRKLK